MVLDSDLVFDYNDLFNNRNNVTHQSQQIISNDSPEGFIESPMWVGTGTRLQPRKLPANSYKKLLFQINLRPLEGKFPNGKI